MANKDIFNLSGGINQRTTPLVLKDSECEMAINYHFDKLGGITKRKGYTQVADQIAAGKSVRGLFYDEESNKYVAVVFASGDSNSVHYVTDVSGSTWTQEKNDDAALTSTGYYERARFVNFVGEIFRVNGNDVMQNASSATATWSGDQSLNVAAPRYIAVFQDRVYAAHRSFNRSRVWYSSLPDASEEISWDSGTNGQWFDVNPDDGDVITGLENNGNRLLIFKTRALYRWTFGATEPDRLIGVGAVNQEVVKTNFDVGITFFANPYGVYAYSGNRPRLLSRKIQPIIDAVTDTGWEESCAAVDADHYYLSVGDLTYEGRTISNAVLVYHISLDAWSIYSLADKITTMATLPDKTTESASYSVYFGTDDGKVFRLNDGTSDDGEAIASSFRSKEYVLDFPEHAKIAYVDVFAHPRGHTQVMVDTDREDRPVAIGGLTQRVTNLRPGDMRRANTIRIYFSDNSTTESVIEGFNIEFTGEQRRDANARHIRAHGND